ncbi:MAG: hypothetical protein ACK58N_01250 [Synechocystis sp.]
MTDLSLTAEALTHWHQISPARQTQILNNAWCCHCHQGAAFSLQAINKENHSLILKGHCQTCGNAVVRVLELKDNDP